MFPFTKSTLIYGRKWGILNGVGGGLFVFIYYGLWTVNFGEYRAINYSSTILMCNYTKWSSVRHTFCDGRWNVQNKFVQKILIPNSIKDIHLEQLSLYSILSNMGIWAAIYFLKMTCGFQKMSIKMTDKNWVFFLLYTVNSASFQNW